MQIPGITRICPDFYHKVKTQSLKERKKDNQGK